MHHHALEELIDALRTRDRQTEARLYETLTDADLGRSLRAWLSGMEAYRHGRCAEAVDRLESHLAFAKDVDPWVGYFARHRLAFSLLQLGETERATDVTRRLESFVRPRPGLHDRTADVLAMQGHLQELRGNWPGAIALFERAYDAAKQNPGLQGRALTTASDLLRLSAIHGDLADAQRWAEIGEDALASAGSGPQDAATLYTRRAGVEAQLGRRAEAVRYADLAIAHAREAGRPETLADALLRRAVLSASDDAASSEELLRDALRIAEDASLLRHAAFVKKELAALLLTRRRGHAEEARGMWLEALAVVLTLRMPQNSLGLVQFAEDALTYGRKLTSVWSDKRAEAIREATDEVRRTASPSFYQTTTREHAYREAVRMLARALDTLRRSTTTVAKTEIDLADGKARTPHGTRQLSTDELDLVELLLEEPEGLTISEIADHLDKPTNQAASKALHRLRGKIGRETLEEQQEGRTKRWRLRTADAGDGMKRC